MKKDWNFNKFCHKRKLNSGYYLRYVRCSLCKMEFGDGINYHVRDSRICRKQARAYNKKPKIDTSILYDEIEEPETEPEIKLILPELTLKGPNEL